MEGWSWDGGRQEGPCDMRDLIALSGAYFKGAHPMP
jgi:hypothetical protein